MAGLLEWASSRLCLTKEDFFLDLDSLDMDEDALRFNKKGKDYKNQTLVLKVFDHEVIDENGSKSSCFGIVCTSRAVFRNVLYAYEGQKEDGILGVTDGTYRIHFGAYLYLIMIYRKYSFVYLRYLQYLC